MMNKKNYNYKIGMFMSIVTVLMVIVEIFWTPYDPETMNGSLKFAGSSLEHLMGCDNFGRDILSRVMVGSRVTFLVAGGTVLGGSIIGLIIGAFAGYLGGIFDEVVMRIMDALFAFPSILLALVIIAIMGPGTVNIVIALIIAFVPSFTRIVRAEYIRCRDMEYVRMAKLSGAGSIRIIFVHILPNIYPILFSSIMIGFNNAVIAEAGLSYLGIGVQPPFASLGRMLSEAQASIFSAPMGCIWPGLALIWMILGLSLLSDGMSKGKR